MVCVVVIVQAEFGVFVACHQVPVAGVIVAPETEALALLVNKLVKSVATLFKIAIVFPATGAVLEVIEGLSDIQIAKLKSLAENIEFISEEDYREKLVLTKKKYFESKEEDKSITTTTSKKDLDSADSDLDESLNPIMEHYVKNISKIVKR